MKYFAPGVYIEQVANSGAPLEGVSASTGGLVGIAPRGPVGVATLVTSWTDFINKFAYGLDTPFLSNSDLSYAVYGFFQNGGTKCYVVRVAHSTAFKASATIGVANAVTVSALEEGEWGNSIKVKSEGSNPFTLTVQYLVEGSYVDVEKFTGLTNTTTDAKYYATAINGASKYIEVSIGDTLEAVALTSLVGGVNGISDITDTDYVTALGAFDACDDVNLIAVPGQVSATVTTGLETYVSNRKNGFAIFELPSSTTPEGAVTLRANGASCSYGALYYPWIKVVDPLSSVNALRVTPPSGHIMGVYARIIANRGVYKAPAGTEATIRGAIELVTTLSTGQVESLNPIGVNCLITKPNYGIVIWGARGLDPDAYLQYVPEILLDTYIKKSVYEGTQWAVFEPNDEVLWNRLKTTIEDFLHGLWVEGALFGSKPSEAYFVQCDAEVNPESVRNTGVVICKVGYAGKKPAEFVVFQFNHLISGNN